MDAKAVYNRVMNRETRKEITDDEWIALDEEVGEWLKTNPPEEEKRLFVPIGAYEVIVIMADGVHFKRKTGRYAH